MTAVVGALVAGFGGENQKSTQHAGHMQGFAINSNLLLWVIVGALALAYLGVISFPGVAAGAQKGAKNVDPDAPPEVCSQPLGVAQTLGFTARDAKTNAELTGVTYTVYTDSGKGYSQSSNTTKPGGVYTILASKSGYLAAVKSIQTSCTDPAPLVEMTMEDYEASLGISVLNGDGLTVNAVTSASTKETLTANVPDTVTLRLKPAAVNQFLAGGSANQYAAWYNVSNASQFDKSGFKLKGLDGQECSDLGSTPSEMGGSVVAGKLCGGDFDGDHVAYKLLDMTVKPASGYTSANNTMTVCISGVDYYKKVNTPNANSVQEGAIKDNSASIQALQCANVYFQ